jgi:hypothetical protein
MRYIISESKLEETIINYFDELFSVDDINSTHPYEEFDDGTEGEDENRIEFYKGDYGDEDTCFSYYKCDYFTPYSGARENCPMIQVEKKYERILDGYFGDTWREPFKKWFWETFDLRIKMFL